jgi:hypothetical protein
MIWFKDPRGFVREDRLARIIPEAHAPLAEQLNAVLRFALYYGVALLVLRRCLAAVYIPAVVAALTYGVYSANASQRATMREDMSIDARTGRACTRPTRDNPFMNVLPSDYSRNPHRPAACDIGNRKVASRAEAMHAHNLYSDSDDVYSRRTSSHAFYTTPSTTIPNDQGGFANWLYAGPKRTCKESGGGDQCFSLIHPRMGGR